MFVIAGTKYQKGLERRKTNKTEKIMRIMIATWEKINCSQESEVSQLKNT